MRIEVRFTLEVHPESLTKLREVSECDTNADAAYFVRGEAEDNMKGYLEDNGVKVRTLRRDGVRVDEPYLW